MASPIKIICLVIGICIYSACTNANDVLYVKLELGYPRINKFNDYTPGRKDAVDKAKASSSLFLASELGYKFSKSIRLGITMHCISNTFKKAYEDIDNTIPEEENLYVNRWYTDARIKIKTRAFFFSGYYDFNKFKNFIPYLGLGLGIAHHGSSDYIHRQPGAGIIVKIPGGYKNSFAWFLGIGLQVPINNSLSLDVGVKYFDYGKTSTKDKLYVNHEEFPPAGKVGTKIKGTVLTAAIVYRF